MRGEIYVIFVVSLHVSCAQQYRNNSGKVLSLLSVIQFPNIDCVDKDGTKGECYTATECSGRGGSYTSSCANGLGVCCYVVQESCGTNNEITLNNTYIRSPSYPGTYSTSGACSHTIKPINSNMCQFRLDFESMELVKPVSGTGTDGLCSTDTLTIKEGIDKSSINYPPVLCGLGTGQHMYLNAYPGKDLSASIAISIGSASSTGRRWSIRVTQIDCGTLYTAPPDCLQYHTGATGTVMTWNYEDTNNIHTNSQNYAICIRREKGYCANSYVADSSPNSFGVDGSDTKGRGGAQCRNDFVAIPGASSVGYGSSVERWCGAVFGVLSAPGLHEGANQIITYRTPFRMYIRFNANTDNSAVPRKGFKLNYRQILC